MATFAPERLTLTVSRRGQGCRSDRSVRSWQINTAGSDGWVPAIVERGDVSFGKGQAISDALDPGKRPVAMLFQDGNLFPHLTAAQNVGLGLDASLSLTGSDDLAVEAALARVGLAGLGERKPAQLSGGQQARVALARLLVQKRAILLLDEPFSALGPALKAEMLALVAELSRDIGATVLMVSHDPVDARLVADDVILVAEGIAHTPVATQQLFDNPPKALRDYLG